MTIVDVHQQTKSVWGHYLIDQKKIFWSHVQYKLEEKSYKMSFKALPVEIQWSKNRQGGTSLPRSREGERIKSKNFFLSVTFEKLLLWSRLFVSLMVIFLLIEKYGKARFSYYLHVIEMAETKQKPAVLL